MSPKSLILAVVLAVSPSLLAGCAPAGTTDPEPTAEASLALSRVEVLDVTRDHVQGDVFHYGFLLKVGDTPNAKIRVHRVVREASPWRPRRTPSAIMLLHGDFATFPSNFAPALLGVAAPPHGGLAVYLAEHDIDVWGMDRRWTIAPTDGADLSDFGDMTYAQELADIGDALAFARLGRAATGSGHARILLGGFSRGGHLAYVYAGQESQRPLGKRHVSGLVPLDVYARVAPEDEDSRQNACISVFYEREALAQGVVDSDNGFIITLGQLAASAPDDPSPLLPPRTNRGAMLALMTKTYNFFAPTPDYHLAGGVLVNGKPTALRFSTEPVIDAWLAAAPFHQALAESADTDAFWCGDAPLPFDDHVADIDVPLFYLGAAGGFGDHGLYTTTLVASDDVTTRVVRRLAPEQEAEDFGHGDLLYADDAPALAWEPLTDWILDH
jgi:hypothetical protein